MITLSYAPLASHIMLEEAGAALKAMRVDFAKSEQRQSSTTVAAACARFLGPASRRSRGHATVVILSPPHH
jgi:hypothetical protein